MYGIDIRPQPKAAQPIARSDRNLWRAQAIHILSLNELTHGRDLAASREQVYGFARKAVELGYGEVAGAAVVCFEWLQRPQFVLAESVKWDCRPTDEPAFLRIEYAWCGGETWHLLEDSRGVSFYPEAEAILAQVLRRGVPKNVRRETRPGAFLPYSAMDMERVVRKVRIAARLPEWFTLDSCRQGGMIEVEAEANNLLDLLASLDVLDITRPGHHISFDRSLFRKVRELNGFWSQRWTRVAWQASTFIKRRTESGAMKKTAVFDAKIQFGISRKTVFKYLKYCSDYI
jgi:hypothetical protein